MVIRLSAIDTVRPFPLKTSAPGMPEWLAGVTVHVRMLDWDTRRELRMKLWTALQEEKTRIYKLGQEGVDATSTKEGIDTWEALQREYVLKAVEKLEGLEIEGIPDVSSLRGEALLKVVCNYDLLDLVAEVAREAQVLSEKQQNLSEP